MLTKNQNKNKNSERTHTSGSDRIIIFINDRATGLSNLFLNDDWRLTKMFSCLYNIFVGTTQLDWLVKTYKHIKYARRESETLYRLRHIPGIPKVMAVGLSKDLNYVILSLEPGLDLIEYLSKQKQMIDEARVHKIVKQVLPILAAIHKAGVVHRDIKPENVLYDETQNRATIIDFENKYTDIYQSPEQLRKHELTSKTDMWSFGVLIHFLLTEKPLFVDTPGILYGPIASKLPSGISVDCKDFLCRLLTRDVAERMDAATALNHSWMRKQ